MKTKEYTVKTVRRYTGDNYGLFVHVFKKGEKSPVAGSSMNSSSTKQQVSERAAQLYESWKNQKPIF